LAQLPEKSHCSEQGPKGDKSPAFGGSSFSRMGVRLKEKKMGHVFGPSENRRTGKERLGFMPAKTQKYGKT